MRAAYLPQRWLVTRGIGPVDRRRALALGGCYVRAVPTMTPEAALPLVETFCEVRNPDHLRDEVRLECSRRGNSITISERRPPWRVDLGPEWTELKVAQLRYDPSGSTWSLYCRDRNERWFLYDGIEPATSVVPLLTEIDEDPTGIFWG